ncbi:MAG: hypothetical protein V2I63_05600 [Pseudomonadales bacterium]|nr:hypothetical protein [Pseudomonadales bacterium]
MPSSVWRAAVARPGRPLAGALAALLLACLSPSAPAVELAAAGLELEYWAGVRREDRELALSRTTVRPTLRLQLDDAWRAELELRGEFADDDTGLGTTGTYSAMSRPLVDRDRARLEIDRAVLVGRFGPTLLTLGKQSVAWGVLDGIQVTDRFDAVRRRDFLFTEVRPERLSRWGGRLRTLVGGIRLDAAVALDATVSQQALPGAEFELQAPRFRAGFGAEGPGLPITVSDRTAPVKDGTAGLRIGRTFGRLDASVLALSGPDTDPLFRLGGSGTAPVVELTHPRRSLFGGTLELAAGPRVWRLEAAWIPDQPVNVRGAAPLQDETRTRTLVGLGLDWNAPADLFVNAQLVADETGGDEDDLFAPSRDVVATIRVQRSFRQETLRASVEVLASLTDEDRALRPQLRWRGRDALTLAIGADLMSGTREGLFGQFRDASRVWARATLSL